LEEFKTEVLQKQSAEEAQLEERINRLREKKERRTEQGIKPAKPIEPIERIDPTIRVGDSVRIKNQEVVGEIMETDGDSMTVSFGSLKTVIDKDRLEKLSNRQVRDIRKNAINPYDAMASEIRHRKLSFSPHLDVRGKTVEEAIQSVRDFIDEAIMVETKELRILHGTGHGILKQNIRTFLRTFDVVESVRDEILQLGGAGITIIRLNY